MVFNLEISMNFKKNFILFCSNNKTILSSIFNFFWGGGVGEANKNKPSRPDRWLSKPNMIGSCINISCFIWLVFSTLLVKTYPFLLFNHCWNQVNSPVLLSKHFCPEFSCGSRFPLCLSFPFLLCGGLSFFRWFWCGLSPGATGIPPGVHLSARK